VSVATTVTPRNLAELGGLRELLAGLEVKLWRLVIVMPIGRAESTNLLLSRNQLAELLNFVKRDNNGKPRIYVGENLPFLADWEKKIRNAPLVCPIGFMACCIGVDGNVRGCPEQPDTAENREGSALEKPLAEIWQNGFGRYRRRAILETDPKCAACKAWQHCYGGCWVMREGGHHCIYSLLARQVDKQEEQKP
jgi:radical SAM protein with 4Fe4S-binding SPASM domain